MGCAEHSLCNILTPEVQEASTKHGPGSLYKPRSRKPQQTTVQEQAWGAEVTLMSDVAGIPPRGMSHGPLP